jgi:hypothetical protein
VLAQCAAPAHLDLDGNLIGAAGADSIAHLKIRRNLIGGDGAESLAGVLAQCAALAQN